MWPAMKRAAIGQSYFGGAFAARTATEVSRAVRRRRRDAVCSRWNRSVADGTDQRLPTLTTCTALEGPATVRISNLDLIPTGCVVPFPQVGVLASRRQCLFKGGPYSTASQRAAVPAGMSAAAVTQAGDEDLVWAEAVPACQRQVS
jgi:hypothetical protein